MAPATLRALLAGLIDYAGLFPPAALPLPDVAAKLDAYRRSADAWMLGRVVIPAARLEELSALVPDAATLPRVSALAGDDLASDLRHVRAALGRGRLGIDSIEVRVATPAAVEQITRAIGDSLMTYLEIPVVADPAEMLCAIAHAGVRAKIRTGGITPDAAPTIVQCARFLSRCAEHSVAFKATAGLHHPLRGDYALTYADDAPRGTQLGFLTTFAAAAFARGGMPESELASLLDTRDHGELRFSDASLTWREHTVPLADVCATRETFAIAFGSCSFREPIDDLLQLGLL